MNRKNTIRVVIAEDDFLVSKDISRTVKKINCEIVAEVSTGEEAVEKTCGLNPDVVLMDIHMPGMGGIQASEQIQKRCPTPIVILTAHETQDLVKKASSAGVGSYVTKPPKSNEIARAITIAMARHADLMTYRKLNEKLKILAQTDTLTGICNRGFFMSQGKKYFDMALRNRTELQLLTLDLDYFKRINDSYGHHAGDQVLKQFAKIITGFLRESDLFGRIGGEEFAVILQNTSIDGAKVFAERIRRSFESTHIRNKDKIIKTTVSIGLASLTDERNIEHLLQKSDVALYGAKNSGRNKIVIAK